MDTLYEKRGKIVGLATSDTRGVRKKGVDKALFIEDAGIEGDAHKNYKRQVSLLSIEDRDRLAKRELLPGDAAENVLIEGIEQLFMLPIGTKIILGDHVILEITEIGKKCTDSPIHKYTGVPILPNVGVFCKVLKGGWAKIGDEVKIL